MSSDNILSGHTSVHEYYQKEVTSLIERKLKEMKHEKLLAADEQELFAQYSKQFLLNSIEEDKSREATAIQESNTVTIKLPLIARGFNRKALELKANDWPDVRSYPLNPGEVTHEYDDIVLRISLDQARSKVEVIRNLIKRLNLDIEKETLEFKPQILRIIQKQKNEAQLRRDGFIQQMADLGIRVKERDAE